MLCHLLAVCLWASHCTSLRLSILAGKTELRRPTSQRGSPISSDDTPRAGHRVGTDRTAGGSPVLQRRFRGPCLMQDGALGVGDTVVSGPAGPLPSWSSLLGGRPVVRYKKRRQPAVVAGTLRGTKAGRWGVADCGVGRCGWGVVSQGLS